MSAEAEASVLVVGAGPVGLLAACELRRHGVPCRLIERLTEPSPHCKALGVTPRTLEVWDDLGIADRAMAAGLGLRGLINIASGLAAEPLTEESSSALAEGAYGFLTLAQYDVERILSEHLATLSGRIERGVELAALAQSPDDVQVSLRHADGRTETVRYQYVIGCDGGRSTVRHAVGIEFEGDHYEQVFMLADVDLDWPYERGFGYKLARFENGQMQAGGACIPVPGDPRRYRFSTVAPEVSLPKDLQTSGQKQHWASDVGPTLEEVQGALDFLYPHGAKASNLRWSSYYRISHRLVPRYSEGRVFLAGDAAHLHPPLGGQGMNAGLQDAYNLAWKLALAVRGLAAAELLDSYGAERRPIGLEIVERTTQRMNRVIEGDVDEQEPVREDSQLWLNYRTSCWVTNDPPERMENLAGPLAGDRAPDVAGLRQAYVRHERRLFDLLRGTHHTLLLYTNHSTAAADCQEFASIAHALAVHYGKLFHVYALLHSDCETVAIEGLTTVVDGRTEFARLYAPQRGSAYLIRPDGHVAYRSQRLELEKLVAYLGRVFRV